MGSGVMLGEAVTNIAAARAPVNKEVATTGAVLNPIKSHVNGFGSFFRWRHWQKLRQWSFLNGAG